VRARWTMRLLSARLVEREIVTHETVRRALNLTCQWPLAYKFITAEIALGFLSPMRTDSQAFLKRTEIPRL